MPESRGGASKRRLRVLVTGGAGYVGARLVPRLLARGHEVVVIDRYFFEDRPFPGVANHPLLDQIRGDIRDVPLLAHALRGCDSVVHLACISNDPSFDLDPSLGRSINYEAFLPLVTKARDAGVRRFIYASSSSVYGVKDVDDVCEEMALEPLTDYSRFKALCEDELLQHESPSFATVILRPATVCGYSARQRLDVIVNILTNYAFHERRILVYGGAQLRPNIHIEDMVDAYVCVLEAPTERVSGQIFNVGHENYRVDRLAELVRDNVGYSDIRIERAETNDLRSYHISSRRIRDRLGFVPSRSVRDAVNDLTSAFRSGLLPDAMADARYYNVRRLKGMMLGRFPSAPTLEKPAVLRPTVTGAQ